MEEPFAEHSATPAHPAVDNTAEDGSGSLEAQPNTKSHRRRRTRTLRCDFCKCRELRRQARTLIEELFFLQPYKCARCKKRNIQFRLNWWLPFHILMLLAIPLAIHSWDVLTELRPEPANGTQGKKNNAPPNNFILEPSKLLEPNKEAEARK